jgi:hypothetical protein
LKRFVERLRPVFGEGRYSGPVTQRTGLFPRYVAGPLIPKDGSAQGDRDYDHQRDERGDEDDGERRHHSSR